MYKLIIFLIFISVTTKVCAQSSHKVMIEGAYVTLGDLFPNAPENKSDTQLLVAPAPGKSVILNQKWLSSVARKYGVEYVPHSNKTSIEVVGASDELALEDIKDPLKAALSEILKSDSFDFSIDQGELKLHFPKGKLGELKVLNCQINSSKTRFQAMLSLDSEGEEISRNRISGRIQHITLVPVLMRSIASGELIEAKDIDWVEIPSNQINNRTILDESTLVGASPRRGQLQASRPINAQDVAVPYMVSKGEAVTVYAKTPMINIITKAKAMENGANNALIRIQNIDSNKIIQATVVGPQRVEVTIPNIATVEAME